MSIVLKSLAVGVFAGALVFGAIELTSYMHGQQAELEAAMRQDMIEYAQQTAKECEVDSAILESVSQQCQSTAQCSFDFGDVVEIVKENYAICSKAQDAADALMQLTVEDLASEIEAALADAS